MTATKDMAELGLDEQALAAKQEHISQLLNGEVKPRVIVESVAVKLRRTRKDKGIPRQKAAAIAQQPGFLSAEQASRLRDLIDTRETRRIEVETARGHLANREGALDAADNELDDFLNELQGKGK